jgi:hypothetical protein
MFTLDGKLKEIDTNFQPITPNLTGNTELDKKLIAKFNGEITQKANDIRDLYLGGKITADEADKQLSDLIALKDQYKAPKKPKKITIKKLSVKKPKVINIKMKAPTISKTSKLKIKYLTQKKKKTIKIKV